MNKLLGFDETIEDCLVVLQAMNQERRNGSHNPFFITLVVQQTNMRNYRIILMLV
jgi:hypothetical protein